MRLTYQQLAQLRAGTQWCSRVCPMCSGSVHVRNNFGRCVFEHSGSGCTVAPSRWQPATVASLVPRRTWKLMVKP